MVSIERKLLKSLLSGVQNKSLAEAVAIMWRQGLFDRVAVEKLYINNEVQRRVRDGEFKVKAIQQVSDEISCSYEKVRAAVYTKQIKKREKNEN